MLARSSDDVDVVTVGTSWDATSRLNDADARWFRIFLDLAVPGAYGLSLAKHVRDRSLAPICCSDEIELLMQELRDRNAEIEALRAAAASDLETRSAVFASASHDVRQRVHALKLLVHAAAERAHGPGAVPRLAAVVDDLEVFMSDVLHAVHFGGDKASVATNELALQRLLQDIDLQFEELATQKQVSLRVRATTLTVRTDAAMLGRVLENLVSNAMKFTRKGVLVAARKRGSEVYLEVWDQGCGFDDDDVQRLAAGGMPAHRHQRTDGSGLGLMIVRRFVDALGYRLDVHSTPGRGTRIRVMVPATHVVKGESG